MQIAFERFGGVAGTVLSLTLPEGSLAKDEADKLQALVDQAHFFDLKSSTPVATPQPDRFHYRLTIEQSPRRHTVEVDEADIPARLRPLLHALTVLARARPRNRAGS
jgi:hypothetical protein